MNPNDLLPFDINKAKRGWQLVTRDGYRVTITDFYRKSESYPLEGTIHNPDSDEKATFTENGKYLTSKDDPLDLHLLKGGASVENYSHKSWNSIFLEFADSEECKTAGPAEKFKALTRWLDANYPLKSNNHDQ
jgi:hypothetical protein